ncbi:MAG: ABC transporter permease, partial [Bacteroidetes bacterium SW_11_45_7]
AIPNSLTPVLIAIAFGVASAILIESLLSFLGIGVQADVITWGKLLQLARDEHEAWWLAIFPGFAIFLTVTIFNLLGEGLSDALDPKQKQ